MEPDSDDAQVRTARDWRPWRKVLTVVIVAVFSFLCTIGSSIITPGRQKYSTELGLDREVSVLPFSLYNFGLAFGPILGSPASETFGRQPVFLVCMPLVLIFALGCGFSNNLPSLLVTRTLGGLSGSAGITIASATIADLFAPGGERAAGLFAYYSAPFLGAVVGPFIGYFVVSGYDWQWTQWVFLFIAAPLVIVGLALLRETKESVLKKRARKKQNGGRPEKEEDSSKEQQSWAEWTVDFFRVAVFRPLHMLFTEMVVGPICLYAGFNFGLLYALVVEYPNIFADVYGFNYVQRALCFLGLIVGCLLGPPFLLLDDKYTRRREELWERTSKDDGQETRGLQRQPENRLHGAMVGGVLLPLGLFWFAWTARPDVSYMSPIFAGMFITLGGLCVYVSTSSYVIEVYGPKYSASANAASSMVRYAMAGAVPLFILPMYSGLGIAWATSLLGFCAALLMPIPWVFSHWGPALRARCNYEMECE